MSKNFEILFLSMVFVLLAGCTSAPKESLPVENLPKKVLIPPAQEEETTIDYMALKRSLGLDRANESLGLTEKQFNTCGAGFGYSGLTTAAVYFTP
jgi:hypothetical protein